MLPHNLRHILAAIIVFLVPIVVSIVLTFEDSFSLPSTLVWIIGAVIFFGSAATSLLTYWGDKAIRNEIEERYRTNLNEVTKNYAELTIATDLETTAERLADSVDYCRGAVFLWHTAEQELYVAHHFNMINAPDLNLRYEKLRGWVGDVWENKELIYYELSGGSSADIRREWRFTAGQIDVISRLNIQSVIFCPIRSASDPDTLVGVLGFDHRKPLGESLFDERSKQDLVLDCATRISKYLELYSNNLS